MIDQIAQFFSHPAVYYGLMTVYVITVVGIIGVIVSENRNPVKSLAWITVLFLVPLFGVVLYIFFGRSLKNTRMISRRNRRKLRRSEPFGRLKIDKLNIGDESKKLVQMSRTLSGAVYYPGNDAEVYTRGADFFDAFFDDLQQARHYINIEFYIISDDTVGTRLRDVLIAKARMGLTVRIIYDHVGSFKTRRKFFRELRDAGVQAYPFFKVAFPSFGTRINWRNHRKICVIDGRVGYIGGMNVADRYLDGGKAFATWRDTHMRVSGPAVGALQYSFAVDWNFMGQPLIEDPVAGNPEDADHSKCGMQLMTSGPTSQWSNIAMLFVRAIANANERVYVQTPYFLPTEGLLRALQSVALSGVDVRVMMPVHSDSAMLTAASRSYIDECLKSGIKIYLYEAGMLHAKTLIVDDEFVSIGSTNFDFRSFEHNFEANMQVYSREFNKRMADIFLADQQSCHRVTQTEWRNRSRFKKMRESLVRLLSPVL